MVLEKQIFARSKSLGLTTAGLAEIISVSRTKLEKVAVGYLELSNVENVRATKVLDQLEAMIKEFAPFTLSMKNPRELRIMLDRFEQGFRLCRPSAERVAEVQQ